MPWHVIFHQDTDTPGVGSTSATWEPTGPEDPNQFPTTHGRQLDTNNPIDLALFHEECEAILLQENVRHENETKAAIKVETILNG